MKRTNQLVFTVLPLLRMASIFIIIILASALSGVEAYGSATPGTEKWRFSSGGGITSSPAIGHNGIIYFGSMDGRLYAVTPEGRLQWRFSTGSEMHASPAIGEDGAIYMVGSRDFFLYALNPDANVRWSFEIHGGIGSSPAIGKAGVIYIGSLDGGIYALDPDGSEKWRFPTGGQVVSSPVIAKDWTVYAGSMDRYLYAVKPDGTMAWRFQAGGGIASSPAIGDDGTVYITSKDGRLYAIDPEGTQKWNFEAGGAIDSSPVIGENGIVYFGSNDNHLYAVDPEGNEKWRFQASGAVRSSPVIGANGAVYFGSDDRRLYAVDATEGNERWRFLTRGTLRSSPAMAADGTLYIGSGDSHLYAINSDSGGLAGTLWPMFRQNNQRTGLHPFPEYPAEGSLRITIAPAGAPADGAQWRRVGTTEWLDSGDTEEDVPEGVHAVAFKEIEGWITPGPIEVEVAEGALSEATGTYEPGAFILTYRAVRGGYIEGDTSQTVARGQDGAAVEAIPRSGFDFVSWSDGETDNPRIDRNVMGDITVTANFASAEGRPGTPDNPFVVTNPEQLVGMRDNLTSYFKLSGDIDMADAENWEPVGTRDAPFTGGLLGDGHKIINLSIDAGDTDNAGLFGYAENAMVVNTGLKNTTVKGGTNVGGLVGHAVNIIIEESYVKGFVSGASNVGGLAGYLESSAASAIINSYADCDVHGDRAVGGVVGKLGSDAAIEKVYAVGRVSGDTRIGGIVGRNEDGSRDNVIDSYWDTDTGPETSAGGKGETSAFMRWKETFPGWDFDVVWGIEEGSSYPYLKWEAPPQARTGSGSSTCFIDALFHQKH